eukprot:scaffold260216_cov45-Attheya_sp.AAC.1
MDEAEQEWKRKECFGTNKTRKESSRFLLELKHRKRTCDNRTTNPVFTEKRSLMSVIPDEEVFPTKV